MRVSAKAEYASIAMLQLAADFDEPQPVRVKAIAEAHGIPQRFLVQILLHLKGAGLVASVRGASGGYQLAKAPEKISLADIIYAIDRAPTAPQSTAVVSPQSVAVQAVRSVWRDVQAKEQKILEGITLADLVRRTQQSSGLSYQI
jgi:Rrf2 family protein